MAEVNDKNFESKGKARLLSEYHTCGKYCKIILTEQ